MVAEKKIETAREIPQKAEHNGRDSYDVQFTKNPCAYLKCNYHSG